MLNLIKTKDGSYTLFSQKFKQHYHNLNDGALQESLSKHIIPCLSYHKSKKSLNILDICFGLGYNTLATLYYIKKEKLDIKINIYSPELDETLLKNLSSFAFPEEFDFLKELIKNLSKNKFYGDENIKIQVKIKDARVYIREFEEDFFHIVYQDAFSSEVNPKLWTKEYFSDIYRICKKDCILSTYSIATPIRLSLDEAGFFNYEYIPLKRKSTPCFKQKENTLGKFIDMNLKKTKKYKSKSFI